MPRTHKLLRLISILFVGAYFVFLLAPIAIMVPASFTAHEILAFPPDQFSARWYVEILTSREWLGSAFVSLEIAILSMTIATVAGLMIGFVVFHYGSLGSGMRLVLLSPMFVPHIVVATGLFQILVPMKMLGDKWVLAVAQAAMALPVTVILSISAFDAIERNLWVAASTLGARWTQITCKVMLPITATSIIACLILSFENSWHEVTLSVFVGPAVQPTLPSKMFSFLLQESTPALAAVSTLLLLITLLCAALVGLLFIKRRRRQATSLLRKPERQTAHCRTIHEDKGCMVN
jgi:ABC-type spermidine/putrescine transport system permease subunit II